MQATTPVPAWRRALSSRLVKIGLSVCLLAILFSRTDLSALFGVVRTANPAWVLAALALYVISQVVSAWRWMTLAQAVGFDLPFAPFFWAYFTGLYMNLFAPSTVAGDIGRALYIAAGRRSRALALTTVIADRALGFVVLVFIGALALLLQPGYRLPRLLYYASWIIPPATLLLWLYGPQLIVRVFAPDNRWRVLVERDLFPYWKDSRLLWGTSVVAALMHILQIATTAFLAWALGIEVPALYFFIFVPVVNILGLLPISFSGIGVREGATIFFMARVGIEGPTALALGLLSSGIVLATGVLGGLVFTSSRNKRSAAAATSGSDPIAEDSER